MPADRAYAKVKPDWDHWGLIDTAGNYVLEPIFHDIKEWKEGIILLEKKPSKIDVGGEWRNHFNGEYGYFSAEGKMLTDFSFGYAQDFYNGLAGVNRGQKWGWIDRNAQLVIPHLFDEIGAFHEGRCHAKLDGKWGWIDLKGKWILKNEYASPLNFSFGMAIVEKQRADRTVYRYLMDEKGKTLLNLPEEWDWYELLSPRVLRYGRLPMYPGMGNFGLMDLRGKVLTPTHFIADGDLFFHVGYFKEGKLFVGKEEDEEEIYGYLYENGEFEEIKGYVPPKYVPDPVHSHGPYEEILDFSEGLAVARKSEKWGVVNENYEEVVPFKFGKRWGRSQGDQGLYFSQDSPRYSCGLIGINEERPDNVYAGYMDRKGDIAIDLNFRLAQPFVRPH